MKGLLCSDCHTQNMKEYFLKEQEQQEKDEREINSCSSCNKYVKSVEERLKPKWQWNLESGIILCKKCFEKKEKEFEIERNFCSICNKKMKFIRYNPKPSWKIKGQLCRECWDNRNKSLK